MRIVNRVIDYREDNRMMELQTDAVAIRIMFLTDDIVRIRTGFEGNFEEASYSLVLTAWEDRIDEFLKDYRSQKEKEPFEVIKKDNQLILKGKKLDVCISLDPFIMSIQDKKGQVLHSDIVDLAYYEDENKRRVHTSEIKPGDHFYGFGEKSGNINKHFETMTMNPMDTMGYNPVKSDSLYKHIPFYVKANSESEIASGYFYHTSYICDFDMGRSHSNYWKKHSSFSVNGGDIDLFFIAGPQIKDVVSRYTDLTGKSLLLPKYALGYLGSSMYYSELDKDCDQAIIDFVDNSKAEDIPIDGFQLSSGYTVKDNKRYVFNWNKDRFKDPKQFFTDMESRGVSSSPNVKPGILLTHPRIEAYKEADVLVKTSDGSEDSVGSWWGGKGVFWDFTSEKAREYWKKELKEYLLDYGVISVWNDNCEYESILDKHATVHFEGAGGNLAQLKSVMANNMCHVTHEAILETHDNVRPFIVCRSGHAGIQRYAQTWSGDNFTSWDSLKYNIATILGMGLSGVSNYGADIGGFSGDAPEEELFVRWVQNGIFQPRFSIHSTNSDNTVTEPWMFSGSKHLISDAIKLRYRLSPYYYSLMAQASETGEPILRPMFYEFQNDKNVYENGIDFMVGKGLLVANVVNKGETIREVYLPKDEVFYDFTTREQFIGGQTVKVDVAMDTIPMFIREGSLIVMSDNQLMNLHNDKVTDLRYIIAPGKDIDFMVYDDDGQSMDFEKGIYLKEQITVKSGEIVTVSSSRTGEFLSPVENITLDIISTKRSPYWVNVDGKRIEKSQTRKQFEAMDSGWYFSQSQRSVLIKFKNHVGDYKVDVSFEEFDMIGM